MPASFSYELSEGVIVDLIRQALILFDPAEGTPEQQASFRCFVCPLDFAMVPNPFESSSWVSIVSELKQEAAVKLCLKRVDSGNRLSFRATFCLAPSLDNSGGAVCCEDVAERVVMTDSPLQWVFKSTPMFPSQASGTPSSPAKKMLVPNIPRRHRRSFSSGEQVTKEALVYLGFAFDSSETSMQFLTQLTIFADRYENFYKIELGENDPIRDGWYDTDIPRFDGFLPPLQQLKNLPSLALATLTSSHSSHSPKSVISTPASTTTETSATNSVLTSQEKEGDETEKVVIYANKNEDGALKAILEHAEDLMGRFPTLDNKARMLALHVANVMGGFGFSPEELEARKRKCIRDLQEEEQSCIIKLGEIRYGGKMHRAILFKYLADNIRPAMPCRLSWKRESVYMPLHSDIRKYKRVSLDDPRLLKQTRKQHITSAGSTGRIINLPDLQTATLEVFELLSSPQINLYRCKIGSIVCSVRIYPKATPPSSSAAPAPPLPAAAPPPLSSPRLPSPTVISGPRLILPDETLLLKKLVSLQTSLVHPNVSSCIGYEETATELRILFEYAAGGTMANYMLARKREGAPFRRAEIAYYALHVARGLAYLHSRETPHRDIRSERIVLDGDPSKDLYETVKLMGVASPREVSAIEFQPPESHAVNPDSHFALDPLKADIWSFGMFLIELTTLGPPYAGFDLEKLKEWIKNGRLPPNTDRSSSIFSLIELCTSLDPDQRPCAQKIVELLEA